MQALRVHSPAPIGTAPLRWEDVPRPEPGPGELLVRVTACALCHTDLHVIEGELPPRRLPLVPGHQVVGVVEAAGAGTDAAALGSRVGVPWLRWACGTCTFCWGGRENLCLGARFTGYDADGGFAQYTLVDADFAIPLPGTLLDTEVAPLLCAGIIGYRALRLAGLHEGMRLGMYGFGASAHLAIQVATFKGAQVFVFSRGEEHRRLAESLGASWTGAAGSAPPQKLDAAIVFAPAGELVPAALETLDRGGRVVLAGIYMSELPAMEYRRLYYERSIQTVANATREDARGFMSLAGEAGIRATVEVFPLAGANRALERLKSGGIRGAGVLVVE